MLLFDKTYNIATANYIIPLAKHGVSYSRLRQEAVKSLLVEKTFRAEVISATEAILFFREEDLLNAINNDAMLFLIRVMLQQDTAARIQIGYSTNWSIVSDYYYGFYLVGLLLRLCLRGTMYFDDKTKKRIRDIITDLSGKVSSIGNNCAFVAELNDEDGEYTIKLTSSSGLATHELAWDQVDQLLKTFQRTALQNSEEYTVLRSIEEINKNLGSAYPSKLRNKVNYHPYYSVKELEKQYSRLSVHAISEDWLMPILTYAGQKDETEQFRIDLVSAYIRYLQQLTFCLVNKYIEQRGRASGILSSINKNREKKIILPESSIYYK